MKVVIETGIMVRIMMTMAMSIKVVMETIMTSIMMIMAIMRPIMETIMMSIMTSIMMIMVMMRTIMTITTSIMMIKVAMETTITSHVDKGGYGDHHDEHHDDQGSSFLESAFYPRAPVHLASTIIARGQPVPTADLNGATHTVIHQSLQGINVGAAANPYAATQPSAVAFATNPLAYHPQAIVHHPSQIGAAAVAQTRTLQHAYGSYEGGNIAYHPVHAPLIGNQRAHTHYARTAFAPRPGDANYGYSPYYPHPGLHPLAGVALYHHHALSHPAVVLPQAHPSGLVYPTKFIELSSKISAYHGKNHQHTMAKLPIRRKSMERKKNKMWRAPF